MKQHSFEKLALTMEPAEKAFKINTTVLAYLGYFGIYSKNDYLRTKILFVVWLVLSTGTIILGYVGHILRWTKKPDRHYGEINEAIAGSTSCFLAIYTLICFRVKLKSMRHIIYQFDNFYKDGIPRSDVTSMNQLEKYIRLTIMGLLATLFILIGLLLLTRCDEHSEPYCGVYLTGYLGFEATSTPVKQMFMIVQVICAYSAAITTMCVYAIIVTWICWLILHLQHLGKMLKQVKTLPNREQRKEHIKNCVLYHYRILELHKNIFEFTEWIMIVILGVAPACIGVSTFHILKIEVNIKMTVHLLMYFAASIGNCLPAELLLQESNKLFYITFYAIPWDGDVQTAKDLYIIMMKMSRELYIPAGKFGRLGHQQLMMLMKSSYSFVTLLLTR